jgi:vancomycin permeability regulator SanA
MISGIELNQSNYLYVGNIFSIVTYLLLFTGTVLIHLKKDRMKNHHQKVFATLSYLILLPLLSILLLVQFNVTFPEIYLFGVPFEKLALSLSFFIYEFILQFLLFFVWSIFLIRGYKVYIDSLLLTVASIAALLIFVFLYSLNYDESREETLADGNNLVFVLGAAVWQHDKPSPIFEGRIEKSLELYKKGFASKIQVTGGNAPGELSEAKTAFNYLLNKGVNNSDMLIEENSSSTHQQIKFLMNNNSDYKKKFKNIILISDEFHMVRIQELCRYYDLEVITITSDYKLNWQKLLYYRFRESAALFLFWLFGI